MTSVIGAPGRPRLGSVPRRRQNPSRKGERIWAFNFLAPFVVGIVVF